MLALLLMAQAATAQLPMPSFLAGCWEQREGERWTEECWTGPRGGLMIGSGRTGKGDTVSHWEYMRIERGANGVPTFHGSPKGAPAVAFKATEASTSHITFVNAGHDFPQRVRYSATTDGIDAEVSRADGSKAETWRYRRPGGPKR